MQRMVFFGLKFCKPFFGDSIHGNANFKVRKIVGSWFSWVELFSMKMAYVDGDLSVITGLVQKCQKFSLKCFIMHKNGLQLYTLAIHTMAVPFTIPIN